MPTAYRPRASEAIRNSATDSIQVGTLDEPQMGIGSILSRQLISAQDTLCADLFLFGLPSIYDAQLRTPSAIREAYLRPRDADLEARAATEDPSVAWDEFVTSLVWQWRVMAGVCLVFFVCVSQFSRADFGTDLNTVYLS